MSAVCETPSLEAEVLELRSVIARAYAAFLCDQSPAAVALLGRVVEETPGLLDLSPAPFSAGTRAAGPFREPAAGRTRRTSIEGEEPPCRSAL